MIELVDVGVYRDRWIFRGVSMQIPRGAKIGLIGRSGVGKSTLLKAICGLISIQEGEVLKDGAVLIGPDQKLIAGYDDIRFVDQEFALDPYHTVEENLREVLLFLPRSERDQRVQALLELSELEHIKSVKAHLISGGEKQRLALVRALALQPEVLVLDEPFVHLDARLKQKFFQYITEFQAETKMTIIMASHDGSELMGFVDEMIHLKDQGIQRRDRSEKMYYFPYDLDEAQLLGVINSMIIDSKELLFRPNEYEVDAHSSIQLIVDRSSDNGLFYWNFCREQDSGQQITLASVEPLPEVVGIRIKKRYE